MLLFTEYGVTVNGNMALANRNGHKDRVSVRNTTMLLRERIKRLVGKGIQVSWKSLPEVKASGLLGELKRLAFLGPITERKWPCYIHRAILVLAWSDIIKS